MSSVENEAAVLLGVGPTGHLSPGTGRAPGWSAGIALAARPSLASVASCPDPSWS